MGYPPSVSHRAHYMTALTDHKHRRPSGTSSYLPLPHSAHYRPAHPYYLPPVSNTWWTPQNYIPTAGFAPAIPETHRWPLPLPLDISATLQPLPREGVSSPASTSIAGSNTPHSEPYSPTTSGSDPSPSPDYVHAVCNAPIIAPIPLPYHSPTFLQFDLPDDDEDLSHPPYFSRPHKRKRDQSDETEEEENINFTIPAPKRRAIVIPSWTQLPSGMHNLSMRHYPARRWPLPAAGVGQCMPG